MNRPITEHYEAVCPFNGIHVCTASLSSISIDTQRKSVCCDTDDYDSCPIFLAKVLRKS